MGNVIDVKHYYDRPVDLGKTRVNGGERRGLAKSEGFARAFARSLVRCAPYA